MEHFLCFGKQNLLMDNKKLGLSKRDTQPKSKRYKVVYKGKKPKGKSLNGSFNNIAAQKIKKTSIRFAVWLKMPKFVPEMGQMPRQSAATQNNANLP